MNRQARERIITAAVRKLELRQQHERAGLTDVSERHRDAPGRRDRPVDR